MINNEVLQVIKNRRSIRKFKQEQIKEEELNAIVEAGIYAPSANNQQSWHFTIIQNKEFIKHISEKSSEIMASMTDEWVSSMGKRKTDILYDPATLIIVSGNEKNGSPLVDCSAAIENMLLAAESLNIGSVWLGMIRFYLSDQEEVKKLCIPEGYKPYYAVALGYKDMEKQPSAAPRKEGSINYIR